MVGASILYPALAVWRAFTEPKCKFFAWLAIHNRVLTVDNLLKRNWNCDFYCSLCLCIHETTDHLLTECNYTEVVWDCMAAKLHLPSYSQLPKEEGPVGWIMYFLRSGSRNDKRMKLGMLFSFWWEILKECNRRIFLRISSCPAKPLLRLLLTQLHCMSVDCWEPLHNFLASSVFFLFRHLLVLSVFPVVMLLDVQAAALRCFLMENAAWSYLLLCFGCLPMLWWALAWPGAVCPFC
jgi:hypothetical protein